MSAGYVYVLTNESMPGLVKIGRSKHGGRSRAATIFKGATGVPTPFKMVFEIWSDDCIRAEADIHEELERYRISPDREFFGLDEVEAVPAVMRVIGYDFNLLVEGAETSIGEGELMPKYGLAQESLIKHLFPGVPVAIILATAIKDCLSDEAVSDAIKKHKDEVEQRRGKFADLRKSKPVIEAVQ